MKEDIAKVCEKVREKMRRLESSTSEAMGILATFFIPQRLCQDIEFLFAAVSNASKIGF